MSDAVKWKPLSPFGAEVFLDLSQELTTTQAAELLSLFRQHYLLLLRDQNLTPEDQNRAMAYLGPVTTSDEVDIVSNDPKVGNQGSISLAFHSDLAFGAEPDLGASLYAIDLIDGASTTSFASGVRAYANMPESLKQRLHERKVLNVWPLDQTRRNRLAGLGPTDPRYTHPIVSAHPATGDLTIMLTEMQSDSIVGLPEAESEALIAELSSYLYSPDNIVTHSWRMRDLVIWDNLGLQHGRKDVSQAGIRSLRRVSIAHRSFFEQFPQFAPGNSGFVDARQADRALA